MLFWRRDRYSDTVEHVEALSHQHRKEAIGAIGDLNDLLRELTTTGTSRDGNKND